jgi:hypothetical protein
MVDELLLHQSRPKPRGGSLSTGACRGVDPRVKPGDRRLISPERRFPRSR